MHRPRGPGQTDAGVPADEPDGAVEGGGAAEQGAARGGGRHGVPRQGGETTRGAVLGEERFAGAVVVFSVCWFLSHLSRPKRLFELKR